MKATKHIVHVIALICLFVATAQAEMITIFDSNATIGSGDSYDTVIVKGDGTIVDMTGGDVNNLIVMNAATFNMSGGNIGLESSKPLKSYDSSMINLSGGQIYSLHSFEESMIYIHGDANIDIYGGEDSEFNDSTVVTVSSDNATLHGSIRFRDNSQFNLSAGSVFWVSAEGCSRIIVSGGIIEAAIDTGDDYAEICSNRKIQISGGTVESLEIGQPSTVTISGGSIGNIQGDHSSKIKIVGYSLNVIPYGGTSGNGQVTGNWNNHNPFSIDLWDERTYSMIELYDGVIPPVCVSIPESDLNGDCKVNFNDFSKMATEWLNCNLDPPSACWE